MKPRAILLTKISTLLLFIALETISIAMVAGSGVIHRYRIMRVMLDVRAFLWEKGENFKGYLSLKDSHDALHQENAELRWLISRYESMIDGVGASSGTAVNGMFRYIPATIVNNTLGSQHNFMIANRGEADGIKAGMGVVTQNGAIGIVDAVSGHYCRIISFLNSSQKVSAKIARNEFFGTLAWTGRGSRNAVLEQVPVYTVAAEGDTVCTSGFSTIFPPDIPLGTVVAEKIVDGSYKNLDITLFQDFKSLRYVYIVENIDAQEINTLKQQ